MNNDKFVKLRRLSRFLRLGTLIAITLMGVGFAAVAFSRGLMSDLAQARFGDEIVQAGVTPIEHAMLTLVIGLALMPAVWALVSLAQLFTGFIQGDVLSARTASHLLAFGQAVIAASVAGFVAPALASVLLSWDNPSGARALVVNLSSDTVAAALFGGLIITVGWAMREAAAQAEENRTFV
ncbi:MAG: hypothetical protein AAF848_09275 [Pseudomonadota bacterium]